MNSSGKSDDKENSEGEVQSLRDRMESNVKVKSKPPAEKKGIIQKLHHVFFVILVNRLQTFPVPNGL